MTIDHTINIELPKCTLTSSAYLVEGTARSGFTRDVYLCTITCTVGDETFDIIRDERLSGWRMDDPALEALDFIGGGWVEQQEEKTEGQLRWLALGMGDYLAAEVVALKEGEDE